MPDPRLMLAVAGHFFMTPATMEVSFFLILRNIYFKTIHNLKVKD